VARANPFARPSKPVVSAPEAETPVDGDGAAEAEASLESSNEAVLDTPEIDTGASFEAAPESGGASAPADDGAATLEAGT
jgi:hypothetical protein